MAATDSEPPPAGSVERQKWAAFGRLLDFEWRRRHVLLVVALVLLAIGSVSLGPLGIIGVTGVRAAVTAFVGVACLVQAIREWPR